MQLVDHASVELDIAEVNQLISMGCTKTKIAEIHTWNQLRMYDQSGCMI